MKRGLLNEPENSMTNEIRDAIETLIRAARAAHAAPDARPEDFTFRIRADGAGVDCFKNWAGVVIPFEQKAKAAE